ncbi:MAG TPA: putative Ig domain-containing protein, partial [Candidatus Paceibacterota bacterium]|nr:putative Ig domain-containing protein [Candidatus Paceibacterota bacterium]
MNPTMPRLKFEAFSTLTRIVLAASLLLTASAAAATLSVTPPAVGDNSRGKITLNIGGIPAGASLKVEKYYDFDADGQIDADELPVQGFTITDGQLPIIGGVRNINVPGDEDATADGQIRTEVFMPGVGQIADHASGWFIYRVSGIAGGFEPATARFRVTQTAKPQGVVGKVTQATSGTPLTAMIALVRQESNEGSVVLTDAAGNFTVYGEPGEYVLLAAWRGYVCNMPAAGVVLNAGEIVSRNLTLTPGTLTVSGQVLDTSLGFGLPGVLISTESDSGWFSFGFTDTQGLIDTRIVPDSWEFRLDGSSMAVQGYVGFDEPLEAHLTTDLVGFSVPVTKANALIYGTIKDDSNQPVFGLTIRAQEDSKTFEPKGTALTANGDYALGVVGGMTWTVDFDDDEVQAAGYFGPEHQVTLAAGQAVRRDIVLRRRTATISGHVRSSTGRPVPDLYVWTSGSVNGTSYHADAQTDADGLFQLGVAPGSWTVGVDCGSDEGLYARGYGCPNSQAVIVTGPNHVLEFLTPALEPGWTYLENAAENCFYSSQLEAVGGCRPYSWTLALGSDDPPPGLTLSPQGVISGLPTAQGQYEFILEVRDAEGSSFEATYTLDINPPLEIVTASLPNAAVDTPYFWWLESLGGQASQSWSVLSNSLPAGLVLDASGQISGTPAIAGASTFTVAVSDECDTATRTFTLVIAGKMQIVTPSPLPTATQGAPYDLQLVASGGQAPYIWSRKPGSANLPASLSITPEGHLSGVPAATGTFHFILRATDSSVPATSADKTFALTVRAAGPGFPIAVDAGDEYFYGLATDGTNYLVTYTDSAQSSNITARLVAPSGALIEPPIRPGRVSGASQAAFGQDVYLVVWEDRTEQAGTDLYAQRLDRNGAALGAPFPVCTAAGEQRLDSRKSLVFDGTNFLVVWRDHRSGSADGDVYGQRIAPDGSRVGDELLIAGQPANQGNLGAAFNGTRTLVIWMNQPTAGIELYETWGAFVSKTGAVSAAFKISQSATPRTYQARVAWNGSQFLALWLRDRAPSVADPAAWDLAARLIAADGTLIDDEFQIGPSAGHQVAASVTALGSGFLVHWLDDFGGEHPAQQGQILDSRGQPAGQRFLIAPQFDGRVPLGTVISTSSGLLAFFMYGTWIYQDNLRGPLTDVDIYGQFIARPPWLDTPERLADGTVRVRFEGGQLVNHVLEASTNLDAWQAVLTTDNPTGTVTFIDT